MQRRCVGFQRNYQQQLQQRLKGEKPVVTLIRTLLLCEATTIQVTRHHDLLTRFLMISFV